MLEMLYLASFLAAGGGPYVDIISLHGYVATPESVITRINSTLSVMQQYGQNGKPVFVTEGSWCEQKPCTAPPLATNQQPGFTFRHYLSMLSTPVQRFYLYNFDISNEGNLWSTTSNVMTSNGSSYQLYYNWLVGATMTQPCQEQSSNSTWTCNFTMSGGYQAEAIWNTSVPYGNTITVSVPSEYVQYRDLYGNVYGIQNHQVPVGYTPIWLENGL